MFWCCLKYTAIVIWLKVTWSSFCASACWIPASLPLWRRWRQSWGNCWRSEKSSTAEASKAKSVAKLYFFIFLLFLLKHFSWAVPGSGGRVFLVALPVLWNAALLFPIVLQSDKGVWETPFVFNVFIQKRKISVSLKPLIVAINSSPSAPTVTQVHSHRSTQGHVCIETGVMQLQQWYLLCHFPSDPTLLKLHSLKQTVLHISI